LEYPCGIRTPQLFLNSIFNNFNNTLLIQEANLKTKDSQKYSAICYLTGKILEGCFEMHLFLGWVNIDINVFWWKIDGHVYEGFGCLR